MNLWPFRKIEERLDKTDKRLDSLENREPDWTYCDVCAVADFKGNLHRVYVTYEDSGQNSTLYYCKEHKKPYDRVWMSTLKLWGGKAIKYIKNQPSEIEVDEKGRAVK